VRTLITELLGVQHPLVGFNRSPAVVAEVSRAGGFGVLAATAYRPDELDVQLRWIEEQVGDKPYGVDLLVPGSAAVGDPAQLQASLTQRIPDEHRRFLNELLERYDVPPLAEGGGYYRLENAVNVDRSVLPELLDVALAHRIRLIANALGPVPPELADRAHDSGILVAALVGKREHALRQLELGVDVLIAQGGEAGGHTGEVATMVLTPEVVDVAGPIPVLAAGGIASGRQMAAALALGASGVWCGSVWLSSEEDITPPSIKTKLIAAASAETVRSRARTGKPARQLRSQYHAEWERADSPDPLPMPLQAMLVADAWNRINAAADEGHPGATELQSYFVGQVVGSFTALRPTRDIVRDIVEGCQAQLRQLALLGAD
jgi:NAD(P)H-dependent flavin oxidoreductase YrpB (nitropropane dioxygenase family)